MNNQERSELLKSFLCQLEDDDFDESVRIFMGKERHADTDQAIGWFDTLQLYLFGDPNLCVWFNSCGEITSVRILKYQLDDRPEKVALSKENWDIEEIDRRLFRRAMQQANRIKKMVKMLGGDKVLDDFRSSEDIVLDNKFDTIRAEVDKRFDSLKEQVESFKERLSRLEKNPEPESGCDEENPELDKNGLPKVQEVISGGYEGPYPKPKKNMVGPPSKRLPAVISPDWD